MPLSPEDIEQAHFLVALRGYDKDQVDTFLRRVADEQRTLLRQIRELRSSGGDESVLFVKFSHRLEAIARAATEAAGRVEAEAAAEAEAMVSDAHEQAARILVEAEREQARIRSACEREVAKARAASAQAATDLAATTEIRTRAERESAAALAEARRAANGILQRAKEEWEAALAIEAAAQLDADRWKGT